MIVIISQLYRAARSDERYLNYTYFARRGKIRGLLSCTASTSLSSTAMVIFHARHSFKWSSSAKPSENHAPLHMASTIHPSRQFMSFGMPTSVTPTATMKTGRELSQNIIVLKPPAYEAIAVERTREKKTTKKKAGNYFTNCDRHCLALPASTFVKCEKAQIPQSNQRSTDVIPQEDLAST